MKEKRLAFVEGFLYLRGEEGEVLKLDLEANIIQRGCARSFLKPSLEEQALSSPETMALGIIGEGCGGNRVFIVDTKKCSIDVINLEDESRMTLLENLSAPDGICKVMCTLYISSAYDKSLLIYDLSKMSSEKFSILI